MLRRHHAGPGLDERMVPSSCACIRFSIITSRHPAYGCRSLLVYTVSTEYEPPPRYRLFESKGVVHPIDLGARRGWRRRKASVAGFQMVGVQAPQVPSGLQGAPGGHQEAQGQRAFEAPARWGQNFGKHRLVAGAVGHARKDAQVSAICVYIDGGCSTCRCIQRLTVYTRFSLRVGCRPQWHADGYTNPGRSRQSAPSLHAVPRCRRGSPHNVSCGAAGRGGGGSSSVVSRALSRGRSCDALMGWCLVLGQTVLGRVVFYAGAIQRAARGRFVTSIEETQGGRRVGRVEGLRRRSKICFGELWVFFPPWLSAASPNNPFHLSCCVPLSSRRMRLVPFRAVTARFPPPPRKESARPNPPATPPPRVVHFSS